MFLTALSGCCRTPQQKEATLSCLACRCIVWLCCTTAACSVLLQRRAGLLSGRQDIWLDVYRKMFCLMGTQQSGCWRIGSQAEVVVFFLDSCSLGEGSSTSCWKAVPGSHSGRPGRRDAWSLAA